MRQRSGCRRGCTRRHGGNQDMQTHVRKYGRGGMQIGKPQTRLVTSALGVEVCRHCPPHRSSHPSRLADMRPYPPPKSQCPCPVDWRAFRRLGCRCWHQGPAMGYPTIPPHMLCVLQAHCLTCLARSLPLNVEESPSAKRP